MQNIIIIKCLGFIPKISDNGANLFINLFIIRVNDMSTERKYSNIFTPLTSNFFCHEDLDKWRKETILFVFKLGISVTYSILFPPTPKHTPSLFKASQ